MNKIITKCECGQVMVSTSKSQMKYNMNIHKRSNQHKKRLKETELSKSMGAK